MRSSESCISASVASIPAPDRVATRAANVGKARELQARLAVGRRREDDRIADRRRLGRRRIGRGGAGRGLDGAGGDRIGDARQGGRARFQGRLAAHQLIELLLELLLVQELPAGDAIDLGSQIGDAILIGVLHVGLAGDQAGQEIVAKGEISGGGDRPYRHHHQRADHRPERHRSEAHLAAAMIERVVAGDDPGATRRAVGAGPGRALPVAGEAAIGRTVRHRRSRADPRDRRNAYNGADFSAPWLIFGKPILL